MNINLQPTDKVINGAGTDTLIVPGNSASYIVERLAQGYRLIDISMANSGRETNAVELYGVENLQFANGVSFPLEQLASLTVESTGEGLHDGSAVENENGAVFNGGSGNDKLIGSASTRDIAIFSGNLSDYWISSNNGELQIRDLRSGSPDGVDIITDVEFLRFADITISVAETNFGQRAEWIGGEFDERSTNDAPQMLFMGGGGNDKIKGSSNDLVVFSGAKEDYVITRNSDGSFTVNDRRDFSPDGIDVVYGITDFRFSDGVYSAKDSTFTSVDKITTVRTGTAGHDKLIGTNLSGNDFFEGLAGNDTIDGQGGHDQLFGGVGNDKITGGLGHDLIEGGLGRDTMDGGAGIDTLSYASSNAFVSVDLTTNRVANGHAAGDKIKNFENIEGSEFGDVLIGSAGVNIINGRGGNDIISGRGAADILDGGEGIDTLSYDGSKSGVTVNLAESEAWGGDAGTINSMDRIFGFENVIGSASNDSLTGDDNQNTLSGGRGNDVLFGLAGADILNGDLGNDVLVGGQGSDLLYGGAGNDTASYQNADSGVTVSLRATTQVGGEAEGDQLFSIEHLDGSEHNDTLIGDDLANILTGRAGDDILEGGNGGDRLDGGEGNDTASYRNATAGVIVSTTAGSTGEAAKDVLISIENLEGSEFADTLIGDAKDNVLTGGGGQDQLIGDAGNDTLYGGAGDDILVGGLGADNLVGGAGTNTADYSASREAVVVNLMNGTGTGGDAEGDTLVEIQSLIGSKLGDTLIGDAMANRLFGGDGADTLNGGDGDDYLVGGAGGDRIDGGAGIDTVDYSGSKTAVNINTLKTTGSFGGDASGDQITNVENFILTSGNDGFIGSSINNKVWGGAGNDTLWGMGGDDYLVAGSEVVSNNDFHSSAGAYTAASSNRFHSMMTNKVMQRSFNETVDLSSKEEVSGKFAIVEFDIIRVDRWATSDRIGVFVGNSTTPLFSFNPSGALTSGTVGNITYKLIETSKANVTGTAVADRIIHVTLVVTEPTGSLEVGVGGMARKAVTLGVDNLTVLRSDDPGATYAATAVETNTLNGGAGSDTLIGSSGNDLLVASDGLLAYETYDTMPQGWTNVSLANIGAKEVITPTAKNAQNVASITKTIDLPRSGADFGTNEYVITEFKFYKLDNWEGTEEVFLNVGGKILKFKPDTSYQDGDVVTGAIPLTAGDYQKGEVGFVVTSLGTETYINSGSGTDHAYLIRLVFPRPATLLKLDISIAVTFNDLLSDESFAIGDFVSVLSQDFTASPSTWLNEVNNLNGGAGDDMLVASFGSDNFVGGLGTDTVDYSGSFKGIVARLSATDADGINGQYAETGALGDLGAKGDRYDGVENLIGSKYSDMVFGSRDGGRYTLGDGHDTFDTADSALANIVDGGAGNDWIKGSSANDELIGGSGDDTIYGEGGNDRISAGAGNDMIYGGAGNDQITLSGGGNDHVFGGDGTDTLTLELALADVLSISRDASDVTTVTYSAGQAVISGVENIMLAGRSLSSGSVQGTDAADSITGTNADDTIFGLDGNDILTGGSGNDWLRGGDGDDILNGGLGADILMGDAGNDTVSYANSTGAVTVNLAAPSENRGEALGDSFFSIENVTGGNADDVLTGDAGANVLTGNSGNDRLIGDQIDDRNLVRDASFEDSLAGSANSAVWSLSSAVFEAAPSVASHGSKLLSFDLNTVNLSASARQTVDTVIGQQYTMSFDIATIGSGEADLLASVLSGQTVVRSQAVSKAGSEFTTVTLQFTATSTKTTILLANTTDAAMLNGRILIDNVRLGLAGGGNDTLMGGAGNDTLDGRGGNDVLDGGDGADAIFGGSGDDVVMVSAGTDGIDGGHGFDILNFANTTGSNTINAATGSYTTTTGSGTFSNIEMIAGGAGVDTITGSDRADMLLGMAGNDVIYGGNGDDIIEGGAGADTLTGGDGMDTLSYSGSSQAVNIVLGTSVSGGDAEGDIVSGFENIAGSAHADTLIGDENDNVITGGGGQDVIDGKDGEDTAVLNISLIDYEFKVHDRPTKEFWFVLKGNNDQATKWNNAIKVSNVELFKFSDLTITADRLMNLEQNTAPTAIQLAGEQTIVEGAAIGTVVGQLTATDPDQEETFRFKVVDANGNPVTNSAFDVNALGQLVVMRPDLLDYETATLSGEDRVSTVHLLVSDSRGNTIDRVTTFNIKLTNSEFRLSGLSRYEGSSEEDYINGTIGSDNLAGGASNDVLSGMDNGDELDGGAGDDMLYGGAGNDTLVGGAGNDMLYGGDGTDTVSYESETADISLNLETGVGLAGEALNDQFFSIEDAIGGSGNDTFIAFSGGSYLRGGAGNDTLTGGIGRDVLDGGSDDDMIVGNGGDDKLFGRAGADQLYGGAGNDELDGGAGADILAGGDGIDTVIYDNETASVTVDLSAGTAVSNNVTDTLSSIENISGSGYDDLLKGSDGSNQIHGRSGADVIHGDTSENTGGADQLYGGVGNDTIYGNGGDDTIEGNADDDSLYGGQGNDSLDGGAGNDYLHGGAGNDTVFGGAGNDTIEITSGLDTVDAGADDDLIIATTTSWNSISGGTGNDTLTFAAFNTGITVNLADASVNGAVTQIERVIAGSGNDTIIGAAGNDVFEGGQGNDQLSGGDGSDTLWGQDGDDTLLGQAGDDALHGGAGNDTIDGGTGANILNGGDGEDLIFSGFGNNTIDGGAGSDTLSYAQTSNDVTVVFSAQGQGSATVNGFTDNFSTMDTIVGGSGNDTFSASSGADNMVGGAGNDTVTYGNAPAAVVASLGTGKGYAGIALNDTYSGIETLVGGSGSDVLIGGAGAETLIGGVGNDILDGHNLLVNGSFESFSTWWTNPWGMSGGLSSGWTVTPAAGSTSISQMEFMNFISPNSQMANGDGRYGIDMEAGVGQHVQLEQVVDAPAGQWLRISLDVTQTNGNNGLDVFYNGVKIGAVESTQIELSMSFQTFSWEVQAVAGATLRLVGRGDNSGGGLSIDNARVVLRDVVASGDTLEGGEGNDTISGSSAGDTLDGGANDDTIYGNGGADTISGGTGNDVLVGDNGRYNNLLINGAFETNSAWRAETTSGTAAVEYFSANALVPTGSGNRHLELDYAAGVDSVMQDVTVKANQSYTIALSSAQRRSSFGDTDSFQIIWRVAGQTDRVLDTIAPGSTWADHSLTFTTGTETTGTFVLRELSSGNDGVGAWIDNVRMFETPASASNENDVINGGAGDDILIGGLGADQMDGGDGIDLVSYVSDRTGVQVDLLTGRGFGGTAEGDTITNVENIRGGMGQDLLGGNLGVNNIAGAGGWDEIHGDGLVTNLITNSSFETKTFDGDITGGKLKNDVTGWTYSYGTATGGAVLALQGGNRFSMAADGSLAFAMRKDGQNGTLSQAISGVTAGTVLTISVDLARENVSGANAILDIYWGDTLIDTIDNTHNTVLSTSYTWFQTFAWQVTAGSTAASNTLRFVERGTGTTFGTMIDKVKVYATDAAGGADTLSGGDGSDIVDGGAGNDVISGDDWEDVLLGNTGDDTLYGGNGYDRLFGGMGNDSLNGDEGSDALYGGDGDDGIHGGGWGDWLYGGAGNDWMTGGGDGDIMFGGDGNDIMGGDNGGDVMYGGAGDDQMYGGGDNSSDHMYGGDGNDLMYGGSGQDAMFGGNGDDTMYGDVWNDWGMYGGDGNDTMYGGGHSDYLLGEAGNDTLYGDNESDWLRGGAGNDTLYGGGHNDWFLFAKDDGTDVIMDFDDGADGIHLGDFTGEDDITTANFASRVSIVQTVGNVQQYTVTILDGSGATSNVITVNMSGYTAVNGGNYALTMTDFALNW